MNNAITKAEALQQQINDRLARCPVLHEWVEMPWGELVVVREQGERQHHFPLTDTEAAVFRVYRQHGLFWALVTLVRGR
jgi:hypothetical protein